MAAVGSQFFHCLSNYMADHYNPPHAPGSGSGSDSRPPASLTSDAQSHHPAAPLPFDLAEYILMEPGVIVPQALMPPPPPPGGASVSAPLVQGGTGSASHVDNAAFQAAQNSVAVNVPITSSADASVAVVMERPRTERIAFRMQSEVEIVDDGYKWRKYGKKAVKNSPNPRNYYRCSTEGCSVKKRVERDKDDRSYVITTYEGVHNHVSPTVVYDARQDTASGRYYVAGMHMPPSSQGL